ncbi:MAG TPA: hypothetical protein VIY49_19780 [Bryobacteraceae bacterium]
MFFSNEPCYDGTVEYGFQWGFDTPNNLTFYYGEGENCQANCYNNSGGTQPAVSCTSGFTFPPLPASSEMSPSATGTGGYIYYFGAYVFQDTDGKYKFFVQVLDPNSTPYFTCTVDPTLGVPKDFLARRCQQL